MPSPSAMRFADLVHQSSSPGAGLYPLTNFTFFLGAGFSKSWALAYPTGPELFQVDPNERDDLVYAERAANFSAAAGPLAALNIDAIKQITYALDMNAKYDSIRSRYVDDQNIRATIDQLRAFFVNRLQQLVHPHWYWFDPGLQKFQMPAGYSPDQQRIRSLFSHMFPLIDGAAGFMQGARFNFVTTNYDWLVEMIVDSLCAPDDSAFIYLYRGVTPDTVCDLPTPVPAFTHWLVFNLFKLNGGAEVFRRHGRYHFDYRERTPQEYRDEAPITMLPSRQQDYYDDYFLAIFPKTVRLLQESAVLVLVGYSLPEEDALLRFIIRQFCEDEADAPQKTLFYVDIGNEAALLARLRTVFPFAGTTLETHVYGGGFAPWADDVAAII